jgi:hypothetical protein
LDETAILEVHSPISKVLFDKDYAMHFDGNISFNTSNQMPTDFTVEDNNFKLFELAIGKFGFDRAKTVNWVLDIQKVCKISDEAIFRGIH